MGWGMGWAVDIQQREQQLHSRHCSGELDVIAAQEFSRRWVAKGVATLLVEPKVGSTLGIFLGPFLLESGDRQAIYESSKPTQIRTPPPNPPA